MLATPVAVADMAGGEVVWAVFRGLVYSTGFLVMALALGAIGSWWALLALPAALLICGCFAAAGQVLTSFLRGPGDLDLVALVEPAAVPVLGDLRPAGRLPRRLEP